MRASGWVGAPIDVVSIEGRLITVDNTRLLAAHLSGTPVQAVIRGAGEALPASMAGRFGAATTWGEAVTARIAGQNAAYRAANPLGSWFIGVTP
jgi:filamentous hemagglutinin